MAAICPPLPENFEWTTQVEADARANCSVGAAPRIGLVRLVTHERNFLWGA